MLWPPWHPSSGEQNTSLLLCQTQGGESLDHGQSGAGQEEETTTPPTQANHPEASSNPRHWSKVCSDFRNTELMSKKVFLHTHRDG